MAASAALIHLGVPVGRAVRALGLLSQILTVLLVFWVNRRIWKTGFLIAFVTALYLAVGTGLSYVAAFFGTPFFALFAALTWISGLLLTERPDEPSWMAWAFALSGLVTGMIRPEGVILAGLMLVAVVLMRGPRASARVIGVFAGVFLTIGGAYFAWHWSYFGYPLPNPFYKKGGGLLHWDSFWESLGNLVRFAGPFALAFVLGFRSRPRSCSSPMKPIMADASSTPCGHWCSSRGIRLSASFPVSSASAGVSRQGRRPAPR